MEEAKKVKEVLKYPDKPASKSKINQAYITDYINDEANKVTPEQCAEIAQAYEEALAANATSPSKYVKATNAAVNAFVAQFFPELATKKKKAKKKVSFVEFLRSHN